MDRLIGRAFLQTKALNDRLTLSINVNASVTNNHSVETGSDNTSVYDAMNYYSPLVPVYDEMAIGRCMKEYRKTTTRCR